ncbi:MAG: hypothetical protein GXY03_00505 [Solirubrobacterales bacterium]|nr:hypothetical protein [Solirubrobacterales bacterium]
MIGDLLQLIQSGDPEIAAVGVLLLSVLGLLGLTLAVLLWMAFVPERVQRWLFRRAPQAPPFYH